MDSKQDSTQNSTDSSRESKWTGSVSLVEKMMRCLAITGLVWSLGGIAYLYWIVCDQPQRFFPLVIRESDSEDERLSTIDAWRITNIPKHTKLLLGDREPIGLYQLDPQLSLRPGIQLGAKERSFPQRLLELNVGVEEFCRDYWSSAWRIFEFGIAALLASILCIAFPRILACSLFLLIAGYPGLYQLSAWWRNEVERQSMLWSLPVFGAALAIGVLAIFRWRIAPAPVEVTKNWNQFWLGLLLTSIGAGAYYVLIAWGGRTRSNGLAGIGLSFGWGLYLVSKHGWNLLRTFFVRQHPTSINSK